LSPPFGTKKIGGRKQEKEIFNFGSYSQEESLHCLVAFEQL
jgi:hypothetical protein